MSRVYLDSKMDFVEIKDKVRREPIGDDKLYTSISHRVDDEVTYEKRGDDWYKIVRARVNISYEVKKAKTL